MVHVGEVRVLQLEVGGYGNNCYIVIDPRTHVSAIIDAAADAERILTAVQGTSVRFILTTHRHQDHWGALEEVAKRLPDAVTAAHGADADEFPVKPDLILHGGDTLQVGTVPLRVLETPGHTPGSVCFIAGKNLFTGDTLFPGGPGYSDDPRALRQEIESITRILHILPPDTMVYPGHGLGTTIGESKAEYAVFAGKAHPDALHGDVLWRAS